MLPDSLQEIGEEAFSVNLHLQTVEGCHDLRLIDRFAFSQCGLRTISLHHVGRINSAAFYCNIHLREVVIGDGVETIDTCAFLGCMALRRLVWTPKRYKRHGRTTMPLYQQRRDMRAISLGDHVRTIPAFLCAGMRRLKTVTIPQSVRCIGQDAFEGCTQLKHVVWKAERCRDFNLITTPFLTEHDRIETFEFGDKVMKIPASLCACFHNLTEIRLPESLRQIGHHAFIDCTSLTEITIPQRVQSIQTLAFGGCVHLCRVRIEALTPPTIEEDVFADIATDTLYVPQSALDAYRSLRWGGFKYFKPIEEA